MDLALLGHFAKWDMNADELALSGSRQAFYEQSFIFESKKTPPVDSDEGFARSWGLLPAGLLKAMFFGKRGFYNTL